MTQPVDSPAGERFVNSLRTREHAIDLTGGADAARWTLRVQAAEAWDAVRVVVLPSTPVLEVKRAAMTELLSDIDDIDSFVVKLRGIEIHDERASLEATGALDGSTLLVMSRRRRPVR